jgi:MFS family permease
MLTIRSSTILLFYIFAALSSFVRSSLGPCMPFLRNELGFSYTVAAYHFTALSIGVIVAGTIGYRIIPLLGRYRAAWLGFAGIALGMTAVVALHVVAGTIFGVFLLGLSASIMGQCIDAIFTERLKDERTMAIAEINIVASVACMAAPAAIGAVVGAGMNWRIPLIIAVAGFAITFLLRRNVNIPLSLSSPHDVRHAKLSPAYWAYWFVVLVSCAAEWSIIFWSTDFLANAGHMTPAAACTAVSAFFIAMLIGRLFGSRIATGDTTRLLPIFGLVAMVGFLTFWLSGSVPFMVAGLFVTGLGISNIYPYTISAALGIDPAAAAKASSRMGIAGGTSGLFGPLLLGCLADNYGIVTAYGAVAMLLVLTLIGMITALRLQQREVARTELQAS